MGNAATGERTTGEQNHPFRTKNAVGRGCCSRLKCGVKADVLLRMNAACEASLRRRRDFPCLRLLPLLSCHLLLRRAHVCGGRRLGGRCRRLGGALAVGLG